LHLVDARRAREECFSGGDRKDRRCKPQLLHSRVLKMAIDDLDLGIFPEIRLLQDEHDVLEPFFLDEIQ
jgi:hypothetical protein